MNVLSGLDLLRKIDRELTIFTIKTLEICAFLEMIVANRPKARGRQHVCHGRFLPLGNDHLTLQLDELL